MNPLTSLTERDFGGLEYMKTVSGIGDSSFVLDMNNDKVTTQNLQHYNRVKIMVDGVSEWTGYIVSKEITLNVLTVRCKSILGILKKRLTPADYTLSGAVGDCVEALLNTINGLDDTGISMGACDVSATINMTFQNTDALTVLTQIASTLGMQFEVNEDMELDFKSNIGTDVSADVELRYTTTQPQQANVLSFDVDDDGDGIVTKSYGKSDPLSSDQDDSFLQARYGVLEKFTNFRTVNGSGNLDDLTAAQNTDSLFSPTLDLSPNIADTFTIGDVVKVLIMNKLVNINATFQILQKSVKIVSKQKTISVKINSVPQSIANRIRDLEVGQDSIQASV